MLVSVPNGQAAALSHVLDEAGVTNICFAPDGSFPQLNHGLSIIDDPDWTEFFQDDFALVRASARQYGLPAHQSFIAVIAKRDGDRTHLVNSVGELQAHVPEFGRVRHILFPTDDIKWNDDRFWIKNQRPYSLTPNERGALQRHWEEKGIKMPVDPQHADTGILKLAGVYLQEIREMWRPF